MAESGEVSGNIAEKPVDTLEDALKIIRQKKINSGLSLEEADKQITSMRDQINNGGLESIKKVIDSINRPTTGPNLNMAKYKQNSDDWPSEK